MAAGEHQQALIHGRRRLRRPYQPQHLQGLIDLRAIGDLDEHAVAKRGRVQGREEVLIGVQAGVEVFGDTPGLLIRGVFEARHAQALERNRVAKRGLKHPVHKHQTRPAKTLGQRLGKRRRRNRIERGESIIVAQRLQAGVFPRLQAPRGQRLALPVRQPSPLHGLQPVGRAAARFGQRLTHKCAHQATSSSSQV